MIAPGLPELAIKYGITSQTILAMTLSVFLLSFAVGVSPLVSYPNFMLNCPKPLFLAPLSEMYGRTWVMVFASTLTTFLILFA
jgi:hypothetical protein